MTRALTSLGWTTASLTSLILVGTVAAQSPSAAPQASWMQRTFSDGLKRLGLLFSDIGSLAGGPATGEVWQVDKRTGERRRIGAASDLSWPAPSPDGSAAYTLRGRQVLRIAISGGQETLVGVPADWRKLLGVLPDGTVIGFVEDDPFPRPALLSRDGERTDLPPSADDEQRRQIGVLLQEARDYADGARLEVRDSERGGRGRDVFLIEGASERNLTDCGDDLCGQPARSMDGATFFYIRSARS
jgi:hypothetical protein